MKTFTIPLMDTKNPNYKETFLVSSQEAYDYCMQFNYYEQSGYAMRDLNFRNPDTGIWKKTVVRAARELFELYHNITLTDEQHIDHANRIRTDNRIENLRIANFSQQSRNRNKSTNENCTSIYQGVDWLKSFKRWRARIQLNEQQFNLGLFKDEESAGRCYNAAVKLLHLPDGFYSLNKFPRKTRSDKRANIIMKTLNNEHLDTNASSSGNSVTFTSTETSLGTRSAEPTTIDDDEDGIICPLTRNDIDED